MFDFLISQNQSFPPNLGISSPAGNLTMKLRKEDGQTKRFKEEN
jgi:hypothetical protein